MTNTQIQRTAWALQLLQIAFQLLSVLVPLYAKWRPTDSEPTKKGYAKDATNAEKQNNDSEATMLIDESTQLFGIIAPGTDGANA